MNVKELIEKINDLPDNMLVTIHEEYDGSYEIFPLKDLTLESAIYNSETGFVRYLILQDIKDKKETTEVLVLH